MAEQGGYGGSPGAPEKTINLPQNAGFVTFEVFETLNTKPPRPAIQDSEMAWCDGFMPFGPSNIRTLYGTGTSIYTASGKTIKAFWFYNFGNNNYAAVLLSDGSLVQVDTSSHVATTILAASTISIPDDSDVWVTQWNSKYLIIVANQANGYWVWDGTNVYGAGGISPETIITNAGSNYGSSPTVHFQTTSGSAVAPTFSATVTNGSVTALNVSTPGSGFVVGDLVSVWFTGGGSDDTAHATATVDTTVGQVTDIILTASASNVANTAYVTLTGGGGTGATAALVANNGVITGVTVTNPGSGYTSAPTVNFNSLGGGVVGTPTAQAVISFGSITATSIVSAGSGYTSPPTVTVLGDGQNAQINAVIDNTGVVSSLVIANQGNGYTKALLVFTGGNNAADADVSLMPFGVQGTTVEVYTNHVWVGDGTKGYFSSPSAATDYLPSNGAGAFQSNDSFQRAQYISYKQTNGFLYLISDSSMNYIGGVQTSGQPPITVFNNLNVDPQIGTNWPSSVQLFSRNIVYANTFGIFVSYGGAVTKISTPLDGIYYTVIGQTSPPVAPSSAIATLFGIAVYMLLLPIIDPITNTQVNKLLIWDGKRWFTSGQDKTLTYINSQEIRSILTAWGTDGTHLFPILNTATSGFTKTVQSKLWANPSYWYEKTNPLLSGLLNFYTASGTASVTVNNETGTGDVTLSVPNGGSTGLQTIPPQTVGQTGIYMGFTVSTTAPDMAILSLSLLEQNYQYLG